MGQAQLKADFTIDNAGGCSPLIATFTNTSSGASASATYQWNFGNGNTDAYDKHAQAIYSNEGTYTVKLTVRDGGQTASTEKTVMVYKKPTATIALNQLKGCAPFPVTFTADAKAGDGIISKYVWDFGDGNVDSTSNSAIVAHSYTAAGKPPVSLTIVNSHGCLTTVDQSGLEILHAIQAGFDASATALCTVGQTVNFTNKSTGPGTLSYNWEMGDGHTFQTKDVSNSFAAKGSFDVTLIATSAEGCADTLTKAAFINVANFNTDFTIPASVCTNAEVEFTDNSTPAADHTSWTITGHPGELYGPKLNFTFPGTGTYQLTMTNTYGSCSEKVTKTVTVKNGPVIEGFIADLSGVCHPPSTVSFKDTSTSAVSWNWDFGLANATDDKKETSYTYSKDGTYVVRLTVTDAQGCINRLSKLISVSEPDVQITHTGEFSGCTGLEMSFATNVPANQIKSYEWDFGDGGTSTAPNPTHVFNKEGVFAVSLKYTTQSGCSGTTSFSSVITHTKPKADFSIDAMEICGSSPASFINLTTGNAGSWDWYFGDGGWAGTANPVYYYHEADEFTVTLVAGNGTCKDTIQKTGFVKVLPPFPRTGGYVKSCKSGEVTLYQDNATNAATKMWWDFGDGVIQETDPSVQTTVHVYDSSKIYNAYLIAENGNCTVKDSLTISVLQRQHPVLTASLTEICGSGNLNINISGLEKDPSLPDSYFSHYSIYGWLYADGTAATPNLVGQSGYFITDLSATLTNLENGQSGIRVIVQANTSAGCTDTSNIVPLTIKGPKAKFSYTANNLCFKKPVVFKDMSVPDIGVPIKDWVWNFSDGDQYAHADTNYPANGQVSHLYPDPNTYYPVLTITDADGCIGKTGAYDNQAVIKGPKADFSYYPEKIFPGTAVSFYNTTNAINSSPQYHWSFTNGTPTYNGAYPPSKTYNALGRDSVTLIAKDPTGCTDTAIRVLYIKDVAASFTYKENYITSSSCPPVIINFTSTSENAQWLSWDFGTGGTDNDNRTVTNHTYYKPGVYRVVLYAYGTSTRLDSSVTYITIKGPYAALSTDTLSGCLNQKVTLNASVKNASSFTWDFGDGSLQQTTDTFVVHSYSKAGVYTPALILKDGAGCSGTSELPDKIVIDSLAIIKLQPNPARLCDSAMVEFQPQIKSIAAETLQKQLVYQWDYGSGSGRETTTGATGAHFYNKPGKYEVSLTVSSPYGCAKDIKDSVRVLQTPHGKISGPSSVCQNGTALFAGSTDLASPVNWKWNFQNGNQSSVQHPEAQSYLKPADQLSISLITENNGCFDTAFHSLAVHKRPEVDLTPRTYVLCLGNDIQLHAHDGNQYQWQPAPGLNRYDIANPVASPTDNTVYRVEVTNEFGCKSTDSAVVSVVKPFKVALVPETYVCYGSAVELPASGADNYEWVSTTAGLNSTTVNAPLASPLVNTVYTVVGHDKYQCFTDTARVNVEVKALPSVKTLEDMELPTGSEISLLTAYSNDVVGWKWSPADYLSCTACPHPVSTPRSDISYVVTVSNRFNCISSDTVSIKLVCAKGLVYIPNAFTPNHDRLNDVFYVKGRGIRSIKSMRVFNRWGQVVFETAGVEINDISKGWDGTYKGRDAESATYVYYIELICDTGEVFARKGTITLIR